MRRHRLQAFVRLFKHHRILQFFLITTPGSFTRVFCRLSQYKYPSTPTATTSAPITNDLMMSSFQVVLTVNAATDSPLQSLR
jgi:hypothetical protein